MADYRVSRTGVVLEYKPTLEGNAWIMKELNDHGEVEISQIFTFRREDLIEEPGEEDIDDDVTFTFRFRLATAMTNYYRIAGRKLGIENDVRIATQGFEWKRRLFAAERNISIFKRIAKLIPDGQTITVGGERDDAIPAPVFEELLKRFPNTYELNRYAEARVANVIGEYIDPERDFREQYESYLSRRKSRRSEAPLRADELLATEIEKFQLVRNTLAAWLKAGT